MSETLEKRVAEIIREELRSNFLPERAPSAAAARIDALYAEARPTREGERRVEVESIHSALSKLESQIARNPGLPPYYRDVLAEAWAELAEVRLNLAAPASPAAQQEPRPETRNEWLHGEDTFTPAPDRPAVEREPMRFPCGCVSRLTPCDRHDRILTSYDEPPELTAARPPARPAPSSGERERLEAEVAAIIQDGGEAAAHHPGVRRDLARRILALATPTPSPDAREVLRLREALRRHGRHDAWCRAVRDPVKALMGASPSEARSNCDCGLAAALNGGTADAP